MKAICIIVSFLICSTSLGAQESVTDLGFNKLNTSLRKVVFHYSPQYSNLGDTYLFMAKIHRNSLQECYLLLLKNGGFDTIQIRNEDRKVLEPDFLYFTEKQNCTVIAPFIFIKDPKRTPTDEIMYRNFVLNELLKALYRITRKMNKNIILPLSENIAFSIHAN